MTLNGPFRPYFSLCYAQVLSHRIGSQELFPKSWRRNVFLLSQGCPLGWHPRHRGWNHSHQSERDSQSYDQRNPSQDTASEQTCICQDLLHRALCQGQGSQSIRGTAGAPSQVSRLPRTCPAVGRQPCSRSRSQSFSAGGGGHLVQEGATVFPSAYSGWGAGLVTGSPRSGPLEGVPRAKELTGKPEPPEHEHHSRKPAVDSSAGLSPILRPAPGLPRWNQGGPCTPSVATRTRKALRTRGG